MGYYCELIIDDYPISADRRDVNPYIVALFDADDLKIFERKVKDRNRIAWLISDDDDNDETGAVFENTVEVVKDRLQILGFTSQRALEDFAISKNENINDYKRFLADDSFSEAYERISARLEILKNASYENFLDTLIYIFQNKIRQENINNYANYQSFEVLVYLFDTIDPLDNFPYSDTRNVIRGLVERLPSNTLIKYDVTDHLYSELYEDNIIPNPYKIYQDLILKEELPFEDRVNEKIIVLTEGSSDATILKRSLRLLYPHLSKYYSFMDFDNAVVPGGSGPLANYTKSFIGSNINMRIISLFDNDTAGYVAARPLSKLTIPANFRILHLPDIELASNYPTLGPTGLIWTDINKSACSIELYFGKDVLMVDGNLCPIQWTGLDKGLAKYQGEITDKATLQERFYNKLGTCEADNNLKNKYDWRDMEQVLLMIFNAFNE